MLEKVSIGAAFQRRVEFEQTMSMLWPTSAGFYVALTFGICGSWEFGDFRLVGDVWVRRELQVAYAFCLLLRLFQGEFLYIFRTITLYALLIMLAKQIDIIDISILERSADATVWNDLG